MSPARTHCEVAFRRPPVVNQPPRAAMSFYYHPLGPMFTVLHGTNCGIEHRPLSDVGLMPYLLIRKHKVLSALQYLVRFNRLYRVLKLTSR
ncbi:hypothetical protein N7537_006112 [Penicillium hordei]|uniref:Uncharacterized protein n=1 Tax=Penicillium hordei TaxID=40994 RepID=A0AAD6E733_9EURO|nr:uncharacterized protein N7537_006112 [Penicillium hordei]KAJ5603156.1 hypothetical protein N7537_006112 [Penicillium hordei]